MTLTLSATDGDIDFKVADGLESVRQRVHQRLLFQRGEYYIDIRKGLPYVTDILRHHFDHSLAERVIIDNILEVEGVTEVKEPSLVFDRVLRKLTFSATIETIYSRSFRLRQAF